MLAPAESDIVEVAAVHRGAFFPDPGAWVARSAREKFILNEVRSSDLFGSDTSGVCVSASGLVATPALGVVGTWFYPHTARPRVRRDDHRAVVRVAESANETATEQTQRTVTQRHQTR